MVRVGLSDMPLLMVRFNVSFLHRKWYISALRGKKDPPKIDPEHIKVLEHLGSVRNRGIQL